MCVCCGKCACVACVCVVCKCACVLYASVHVCCMQVCMCECVNVLSVCVCVCGCVSNGWRYNATELCLFSDAAQPTLARSGIEVLHFNSYL